MSAFARKLQQDRRKNSIVGVADSVANPKEMEAGGGLSTKVPPPPFHGSGFPAAHVPPFPPTVTAPGAPVPFLPPAPFTGQHEVVFAQPAMPEAPPVQGNVNIVVTFGEPISPRHNSFYDREEKGTESDQSEDEREDHGEASGGEEHV